MYDHAQYRNYLIYNTSNTNLFEFNRRSYARSIQGDNIFSKCWYTINEYNVVLKALKFTMIDNVPR